MLSAHGVDQLVALGMVHCQAMVLVKTEDQHCVCDCLGLLVVVYGHGPEVQCTVFINLHSHC
jgi:hypothetical protein